MSQPSSGARSDADRVADSVGSGRPVRERDRRPPSTSGRDRDHGPLVVGLLVGIVLLCAVVAFGVALPMAQETDPRLPDRLPGGWTAVDLRADEDPRLEGLGEAIEEADEIVAGVYDHDTAVRAYVDEDVAAFARVVLFEAEGGAYVPEGLPGPNGRDVRLTRQGDAVCVEYLDPADPGESSGYASCQVSADGWTAQVGGPRLAVEDAAGLAEAVLGELD